MFARFHLPHEIHEALVEQGTTHLFDTLRDDPGVLNYMQVMADDVGEEGIDWPSNDLYDLFMDNLDIVAIFMRRAYANGALVGQRAQQVDPENWN